MRSWTIVAVVVVAALASTGCGRGEGKKAATQVAARVNKEEISVHQVNHALSRSAPVPPEQTRAAGRQALDRLIDQSLFVQQAIEKKLDRDPRVMQVLEAARHDILSRAYADQIMVNAAKPGADEIKSFYAGHPELFRERRIFSLQEIAVVAPPAALQEEVARAKSMSDVANWLREKKIPFLPNAGVKAAEQLPLELLPKYHALRDGQIAYLSGPAGAVVVHLVGSQPAPMDEKAATPFIEQFLLNRKRAELAEAELRQLKGRASIEYLGDFAQAAEPAQATAAAPATHIDKGVAGLK